jgi:hypothetical protein
MAGQIIDVTFLDFYRLVEERIAAKAAEAT